MINAKIGPAAQLIERLTQRAAILAEAHAENALRAKRREPSRWRKSRLLWPLFSED